MLGKVLDLASYTNGKIAAYLRLDGEVVVYLVLVLQYGWNLKIIEVIGHLLAFRRILLATFLYI